MTTRPDPPDSAGGRAMTLGLEGRTSLSRTSDHLGNLANVLKDLGGGATLLYELVQNADDAHADTVRFTQARDELVVWNSGNFTSCGAAETIVCPWRDERGRACDLHSFRVFAGRQKSADSSTTGAFGVGFTAVYQVTDHPELVASGAHLILDDAAESAQRIAICDGNCRRDHGTPGTTFYLPWARHDSYLRRALSIDKLTADSIAGIVAALHESAPHAAVFLTHIRRIEVVGDADTTAIDRAVEGDRIVLTVDGERREWLLLEGHADRAECLKLDHEQIDSGRSSAVQIAIPFKSTTPGRVYAGLPTETRTGWAGHINGSFYPRQDRKGVEFGVGGSRSRWNEILIEAAADVLAINLETIGERLGYSAAWDYLASIEVVNREIAQVKYPECFSAFFARAKEHVRTVRIALLADGTVSAPDGSVVPRDAEEYEALEALNALEVPLIDESIRPIVRQTSHTQYGVQLLNAVHIVDALTARDVDSQWTAPGPVLANNDAVETLLALLQRLSERGGSSDLASAGAARVALVPCVDGSYGTAAECVRLSPSERALFELLDPDIRLVDDARLGRLCPALLELCDDITPERAIEIFDDDHEALAVAPDEILDWLDNHRSALQKLDTQNRVRQLPIYPSTTGVLKPLSALSLASSFDDFLGVADVVDRQRIAGHEDLLRFLGAKELDALEYLTRHVVPSATAGALGREAIVQVLEIIYNERPHLDADDATRLLLASVPLVACADGVVRPANKVHLPSPALALISPDEPTADLTNIPEHLVETLVWLGVCRAPNARVLSDAARRLASAETDPATDVVLAVLDALPDPLPDDIAADLLSLVEEPWLPVEGGGRATPPGVYAVFRREIFESQGPKLALPRTDQNRRSEKLDWLGVQANPRTSMVLAHLRHCVETRMPVNEQVYRALGEAKDNELIRSLRGQRCIQVRPGVFVEPDFAYWTDPGLGRWAHQLPRSHRQYQSFYDLVEVSESPSPEQTARILREISRAVGTSVLDDQDAAVVHRCWELLDNHLRTAQNEGEAVAALRRLGATRTAIDARGMLEQPGMLLFVDGRHLAEKIDLIRNNLIRRERTTQKALSAAGARPAEDVIDIFVDPDIPAGPAEGIRLLVEQRTPAIRRLIEAHRDEEVAYDLERLPTIEYLVMPGLMLEYRVRFAHRVQVTDPEPAEAVYLATENQLIVRSEVAGRHLAREVARCLDPQADVSAIAPSLHEILAASTLEAAMEVLNEYGVRDLHEGEWEHIATEASEDEFVDGTGSAGDATPGGATRQCELSAGEEAPMPAGDPTDHEKDQRSGAASTDGRKEASKKRASSTRGAGRPRMQMASYVVFDDDKDRSDLEQHGDEAPAGTPVDAAGVRRVVAYEESCGREPEVQPHNNPGFDVLSRDAAGSVARRIEIKSVGGPWTGFGVWLSAVQVDENRARGDDFWLYVVEYAENDDAFRIHRIQNPISRATKFGFDDGWQALDEPEVERDQAGQPLLRSTRRLLGWGGT